MALIRANSGSGGGSGNVQVGTFTAVDGNNSVPLDFEPSKLYVYKQNIMSSTTPNGALTLTYDKDLSTSYQFRTVKQSGSFYVGALPFPNASANSDCIRSISATEFVINTRSTISATGDYTFIAVK